MGSDKLQLVQVGNGTCYQAIKGKNKNNGTDDAVNQPHRTDIEMSTDLIDKERND